MTNPRPLVIIGGGPAGMAAAIEAARAGLRPTLIDESPRLGGQVYRQPPEAFSVVDSGELGPDFVRSERLRAEFAEVADGVEALQGTAVLGVWPNRDVLWATAESSGVLGAERLIIASGAYDRPVPFPGWTLPGVMTAGATQTLMKSMRVRPGERALVSGTGPLLFGVARRLLEMGVEVVSVLEAGDHRLATGAVPAEWRRWEVVEETLGAVQALTRAEVPLLFHHAIFEARGSGQVEEATFGPLKPDSWEPLTERAQRAKVDLVVTGFGFIPNTELTHLAGCRHEFVPDLGGWVPLRDAAMETTVPDVFAVGDGAGIRGVRAAVEEGRLAGITASERAGVISWDDAERRRAGPVERLGPLVEASSALSEMSRMRPGLLELVEPETLACRCEEVTYDEVEAAVGAGAKDLQAAKLFTRLGMGPCQGRNCAPHVGMYLGRVTGRGPHEVGRINPRPPVKPVTLGVLAAMEGVEKAASVDPLDAVGGGAS